MKSVMGVALACAFSAGAASAQTSRLYMQDAQPFQEFNNQVRIAQGGTIIDTLELKSIYEHNLVVGGDLRTYPGKYYVQNGYRYDLDGVWLGQTYPPIDGAYYGADATTDGTKFNWIFDYYTAGVYRYSRNWKNGVLMFSVQNRGGIAYDPDDGTLWILETDSARIRNVKQSGAVISEFIDGTLFSGYWALALDPADGTLWAIQGNGQGDGWRQYSRDGALLSSGNFGSSKLTGSAEFDMLPVCYPDFDGNGALDLFDFLGYVNAFNAEDPQADCDHSGVLDLFDFLCFVNAFNAGC
jgi:hypothetical protein